MKYIVTVKVLNYYYIRFWRRDAQTGDLSELAVKLFMVVGGGLSYCYLFSIIKNGLHNI